MRMNRTAFALKFFLKNPRSVRYYRELDRNQRLSLEDIERLNWEKRKRLIAFAYAHVPYYRELFDRHKITPQDIKKPLDFRKIPVLTKDDIRNNFDSFIPVGTKKRWCSVSSTGGSTGDPLTVLHDRRVPLYAMGWRMLRWWGIDPWDDSAYVWRALRSKKEMIVNTALWWPTKRIFLDASSFSEEDIRNFIDRCNTIKPSLVQGYTGALCQIAQYCKKHMLSIHAPLAIWTTSSPISNVHRNLLFSVFHSPVYSQYGCGEILWVSAECSSHSGLHIFDDARYVEVVDGAGNPLPDEAEGTIAITDLENYVFPLIRYMNGDIARMFSRKCDCGVSFPLMDYVRGRETDNIILPDGRCISGDYLTTIFDGFPEVVYEFQVRQRNDFSLVVLVVPNNSVSGTALRLHDVEKALRDKTQGQIPIEVRPVESIAHDKGKLRFVVSEVTQ